jgi:serine/threonine-protein phosphatase 2B regulatory subunit
MGNKKSCPLKSDEIANLVQTAKGRFTAKEVKALYTHFMLVSSIDHKDGLIDNSEFGTCMGLERSTYLQQQIFNVFDKDGDGRINFTEFLQALSVLSHKAPKEDKLSFSFRMYDRDGDRKIGKVELSEMLKTAIQSLPHKFTDEQVAQLIETTFKEADLNNDGYINFDEYCKMSIQHPQMLSQMTINVSESIKGFGGKKKLKVKKKKNKWGGKAAPPPAP